MKFRFSQHIFQKYSNTIFHENPSSGNENVQYVETDGWTDGETGDQADGETVDQADGETVDQADGHV